MTPPTITPAAMGTIQRLQDADRQRAARAMREVGADRGRNDDRERRADAKLHADVVRHAEDAENFVEHRHDDGTAADAEQSGQQPGQGAADHDRERKPGKLAGRNAEHR